MVVRWICKISGPNTTYGGNQMVEFTAKVIISCRMAQSMKMKHYFRLGLAGIDSLDGA
jgi:hypothetical protein